MIETIPYRESASKIARALVIDWLAKRWWIFAIIGISCLIVSFYDIRWLIVLAAITLILFPAILAHVYFKYALTPAVAMATIPHTVTIDDACITIHYQTETDNWQPPNQIISYDDVIKVDDDGKALTLWYKETPGSTSAAHTESCKMLIIPVSSFSCTDDLKQTCQILSKKCNFGTNFVE